MNGMKDHDFGVLYKHPVISRVKNGTTTLTFSRGLSKQRSRVRPFFSFCAISPKAYEM